MQKRSAEPLLIFGDFSIFQDGGRRHLGFSKFETFNGGTARERRTASPCQISRRSVIPLLRYRRFSICKMAAVRHLGFQKSGNFIGWRGRDAYPSQILSKLVKPWPRYGDFSIFSRWRPSAILDLLCACLDHPRRVFGGLYRCAKFGWNRFSSFDNMHVFRFREFGLKTPIHAPKIGVFRGI